MNIEPVEITDKALKEVRNIMDNKGIPTDYCLRIGMKGGGCGGMGYVIGFDQPNEEDISYSRNSIPIIVDKKHVMYLIGLEVDFHEDDQSRGFVFNKPERLTS
ncbi:HesB/IscA family protein [Reichenbachiella versicolor]|uniref:HesB/IscA family protein n=1 Tax=Reichenbachiella versicolor TaxID=1821036 RepID=UPI000D6DCC95|nr:iron-sulfur cluster assembly accessory protein [Reichenbachiella versicolor]